MYSAPAVVVAADSVVGAILVPAFAEDLRKAEASTAIGARGHMLSTLAKRLGAVPMAGARKSQKSESLLRRSCLALRRSGARELRFGFPVDARTRRHC